MKKALSLVLALALALSLSVPALAAEINTDNGSKDVTATYVDNVTTIYGVDISWGSMQFTYTSSKNGWSTDSHSYDNSIGAWTYETEANIITVTNHSNAGIDVTPSWTADSGFADVSMVFAPTTLSLATADNGTDGAAGTATSGKIAVTPFGDLPKDTNGKIGTITLTINGKGDDVNSAALAQKLEDDLNNGGTVTLTGDIAYDDTIRLKDSAISTLDLSGYYLNADVEINQGDDTSLTIKDSGTGGKVRYLSAKSGYLTLQSGTVEERVDISGTASFSMNSGTVNGGVYVDGDSMATINSGIISSDNAAIKNTGGIVTIFGGTFDGDIDTSGDDSWTMIYNGTFSGDIVCHGGDTDISKGTFNGEFQVSGGQLSITGGTFKSSPSAYVDTATHTVITNEDGTYTVKAI